METSRAVVVVRRVRFRSAEYSKLNSAAKQRVHASESHGDDDDNDNDDYR